ncbi:hypothetical protein WI697_03120 [Tistrella mobilis]|uniref:hypothetical protein n=1 Tax=Tistrella mobilis TaxID=171437 RepID=UPI0031F6FE4D
MSERKRQSLFGAEEPEAAAADPLGDLSDFRPGRRHADDPRLTREVVRPLAEQSGFRSRDPRDGYEQRNAADDYAPRPRGRPPGPPTVAVSLRVNARTAALLDQIAAEREWTKTRTFERAVAALELLLKEGKVDPKSLA